MKRALACVLFLMMVICVGCGGSENAAGDITATETPEIKVAIEPDESDLLDPLGYVEAGMIGMNEKEVIAYDSGLATDENGDLSREISGSDYLTGVVVELNEEDAVTRIKYEYNAYENPFSDINDLLESHYEICDYIIMSGIITNDRGETDVFSGNTKDKDTLEEFSIVYESLQDKEDGIYGTSYVWELDDKDITLHWNFMIADSSSIPMGVQLIYSSK